MEEIEAHASPALPVDDLNERIGVLSRREVEARILAPLVEALSDRFGRAAVLDVLRGRLVAVATEQGAQLAMTLGGDSLGDFARGLEAWTRGGALEIELIESSDELLAFDVTRCRYAELYRALGIPELGALLSCNRDAALIEGFRPGVEFVRTQTIMAGAPCCDFRYRLPARGPASEEGTTA